MRNALVASALFAVMVSSVFAGTAQDVVTASGVKGGLVVSIGCDDPKFISDLLAGDSYLVHGLDADSAKVDKARGYLKSKGLYGKVSVDTFDGKNLPYADNLVNVIVMRDTRCEIRGGEIERVLAPGGRVVAPAKSRIPHPVSRIGAGRVMYTKPVPSDIDEWTHYLHGPGNNAVSQDTAVGPPKRYQWICGPAWARSHDHLSTTSAMVSSGGRIFYILDEGSTLSAALPVDWKLIARDAYSGVLLWKRDIDRWEGHLRGFRTGPSELARRIVAIGDRVYVTLGYGKPIEVLDAATGKTLETYRKTKHALEFVIHGKTLLAVVGDRLPDNTDNAAIPAKPNGLWMHWPILKEVPPTKHILALNTDTGKEVWRINSADTAGMMPTTLAASAGRVFFHSGREIVCVNLENGEEAWRTPREINLRRPSWSAPTLVIKDDVLLCGDRDTKTVHPGAKADSQEEQWVINSAGGLAPVGTITAFSAVDGKKLWEAPAKEVYNAPVDVLVADGLVWSGNLVRSKEAGITKGLDLRTGEVKRERPNDSKFFKVIMGHHRCYRNKATEKYLVLGRDGIEYIDVKSGDGFGHAWVRGACQYGVMPCNGLTYSPPHSCACHIETKLNSFNVMSALPVPEGVAADDERRLEKGPAYGQESGDRSQESGSEWPTYRGDAARSGGAGTSVVQEPKKKWAADIGGRLSAVTVADGKCFVAGIDTHTVYALDAESGKTQWEFTAGGRVDSPPTIHKGMALFGSADGHIYSVRASDGVLAWAFNAALSDQRIVSYGQLESVSPVHGSVLVDDDTLYAVAGRNAFLDGGMRIYALDTATGMVLSHRDITGNALPDVLSSDGDTVYMRHRRFNKKLADAGELKDHLYSAAGFLDGTWWHRTYWLYGKAMRSNYGGWPSSASQVPAGRLMACVDNAIYGFGRFNQYDKVGGHVGLGKMKYYLYAHERAPVAPKAPAGGKKAQQGGRKKAAPRNAVQAVWKKQVPVLARGMVATDELLFVAGPPDTFGTSPDGMTHPYNPVPGSNIEKQIKALSRNEGARLVAVSRDGGELAAEHALESYPVWDGMAAAYGSLYIAGVDGTVTCFR